MLQTLSYIINVAPEGVPQVVKLSQNENGRTLAFTLTGAGTVNIPSGSTVTISGTKPDGVVYSATGTLSGNVASFSEDTQMTAVSGIWPAKIKVTYSGQTIATCEVVMAIDPDPVAPGSVPSSSVLNGLVAEAQQYATYAKYEAFGSPLVAATAAAMTDKTRVYVYTGSETGKTAGHWYYWNGSAWTDGGVYNSQGINTDTTLTISGMAADAKATGDQFTLVKQDISELNAFTENFGFELIEGKYVTNTGTQSSSAGRRMTNFIPCEAGMTIKYCGETNNANVSALTFYSKNNYSTLQTNVNVGNMGVEYTAIAPANTAWLRLSGTTTMPTYVILPNILTKTNNDITTLFNKFSGCSHVFIPGSLPYCCNFADNKIKFVGVNYFVFNDRVVDIPNGSEYSYASVSQNLVYVLWNESDGVYLAGSANAKDRILGAFFKNNLDVPYANTFNAPVGIDGASSFSKTLSINANMTSRLLITDMGKPYVVEGNNHEIDLGEYLTGTKVGNITTIPYTASDGSYYKRVFIDRSVQITPIRQNVYYAVMVAIKNGVYTRLTPYYAQSDVESHSNSFTYDGSNIIVNCADYDSLVAIQNTLSCLDIRSGVNATVKNLTVKHSFSDNVSSVNGANVTFVNVKSICSGISNGFRCDYGDSKFYDCSASYNGQDGYNFNHSGNSYITNCNGDYNLDDGISHHEQGTVFEIDSCIFTGNAKGGISSPVLGAEGSVKNCVSDGNMYGIYTYQSKRAMYSNVVTKDNTHRILNSNPVTLINCISVNDGADSSTAPISEYSVN